MITEKIPGLQKLSDPEKLLLINELWDSLAEGKDTLPVPESHKRILDERLREHEENPEEGSSWEEVKSRIRIESGTQEGRKRNNGTIPP